MEANNSKKQAHRIVRYSDESDLTSTFTAAASYLSVVFERNVLPQFSRKPTLLTGFICRVHSRSQSVELLKVVDLPETNKSMIDYLRVFRNLDIWCDVTLLPRPKFCCDKVYYETTS